MEAEAELFSGCASDINAAILNKHLTYYLEENGTCIYTLVKTPDLNKEQPCRAY